MGGRVARAAKRHLAPRLTLRRAAEGANVVGHVVGENLPQPAEPLFLRRAVEPLEIAVRLEHRLLDHVRGVHLHPQPAFDLRPGDVAQVVPAPREKLLATGRVSPTGLLDQIGHAG